MKLVMVWPVSSDKWKAQRQASDTPSKQHAHVPLAKRTCWNARIFWALILILLSHLGTFFCNHLSLFTDYTDPRRGWIGWFHKTRRKGWCILICDMLLRLDSVTTQGPAALDISFNCACPHLVNLVESWCQPTEQEAVSSTPTGSPIKVFKKLVRSY